ncbi:hypothetical protein OS123_11315, partial [Corynebacterium sp. P5875]
EGLTVDLFVVHVQAMFSRFIRLGNRCGLSFDCSGFIGVRPKWVVVCELPRFLECCEPVPSFRN